MWTLLILGICSSLQLIVGGNNQRQPLHSSPLISTACKADEEYQKCGCLKTCCNEGKPTGCDAKCNAGCFCKDGLVRNKNGDCITLEDCKKTTVCPSNEEYSECVNPCNDCKIRGKCQFLICNKGCDCKQGYHRDDHRRCIPAESCPSKGTCPSDEQYYDNVPSCKNTCKNYDNPGVRCPAGPPGCFCKEGLVKREDGKCVSPRDCVAKPPVCGQDEKYYDTCAPSCTRTCEAYNSRGEFHCPSCKPGCWCKDNLYKDSAGKCVPASQCDTSSGQCGKNEEFKACGTACQLNCSNLDQPRICTEQCVRGCFCKENFVRNQQGVCIDPEECPSKKCSGENEIYDSCGSACPKTCKNKDKTIFCTLQCVPGCFCKPGFVRNAERRCIDPSQCESSNCPPDEQYYDNIPDCKNTCEHYDNPGIRCRAGPAGCFCKEGLVKRKDGKCVKPRDCVGECPPDEQYYDNIPDCKNTCEHYDNPGIRCRAGPAGCFCKEGLVKRKDGKCVKPRDCVDQCGVDEVYQECGTACPRTCASLYTKIRCIEKCVPGCFCRDDLVRHDGRCIDIRECQTQQCGANEVYKKCGSVCPPTCPSVDKPMEICTDECVSGCFCEDGFVRNDSGECIKLSDCPHNQCGADEEYKNCGTACPLTCSNYQKPVQCTRQCVKGCFCKEGLIRNDDGKCVNPNQCPMKGTCGKNEEYQECGTACPRTCRNLPYQMRCIAKCVEGCFCKDGMVRNDNNECVDPQECPSEECGENEEFNNCGSACPVTCDNKDKAIMCTLQCKIGCFCKKGYVRNSDGKCIPSDQCPKECNGESEELVDCAKPKWCNTCDIRGNCKLANCEKGCDCKPGYYRNAMEICIPESQCTNSTGNPNGSDCDKGPEVGPCKGSMPRYYYDQGSGTCKSFIYGGCKGNKNNFVTQDDCLKQCGGSPNGWDCDKGPEVGPCLALISRFYYDQKSGTCKRFTYGGCQGNRNNFETEPDCYNRCGGIPSESVCDQPKEVGRCRARMPRFYYDRESGRCKKFNYGGCGGNKNNFKSVEECNKKCRGQNKCADNEVFMSCGTACPASCSNREKRKNCTKQCVKGCFCKEGLVRNDDGKCVEPDKCPSEKCPWNEEYQKCGTGCPKTCKNLHIQITCIDKCFEGCFCKKGLVRNDDGECVEPSECPGEQCGENEEYRTCASACPMTCANKDKPIICTLQCKIGCTCKKGYVKNDEGKCVLPEECPKEECNGTNEALVDCAKPKWCNTCGIRGNCKLTNCQKGCDCKPNYYRDDSGICIFKAQCPGYCPTNEEYSKCVNPCNDCETRGKCNFLVCNEGCDCKKGYHRAEDNKCIPEETCPVKHQCQDDEVYKQCGTACPRTCSNLNIKVLCIDKCVEGCFCKDGLVRNGDGKCVKPDECPNDQCGEGEVYKQCGTACPQTCSNLNIKIKCIAKCVEGCFCKDGLVRNGEGKCVDRSECPNEKCTGYNEEFVDCVKPKSCNTCEIKGNCKLKKCDKGCDCKPNYYRNATEICIPEAECSSCPVNEEYSNCANPCNTCEIRGKCNFLVCNKGCDCKKGYYRDANKKCIPAATCPIRNPTHCAEDEQFYNCTPDCKNTCKNYNKPHVACPKICRRGCFCKEGLVKRSDGKCVPPEQCDNTTEPPSRNCGPREEFYNCVPTCRHTCETYRNKHMPCPLYCRSGCFCKKGLVKRKDGKCVYPKNCNITTEPPGHTCGRREQYYDCIPDCRNTCDALNKTNLICPLICRSGCFCREGLVLRKDDNKCVRPEKCNNQTEQCGRNEEYNTCGNVCERTCDNKDEPIFCTRDCKPGCFCKTGYVRNNKGKCVREDKCPSKQCGRNEEHSTCGTCEKTCDNKDEEIVCTQECRTGCFCKKDYVRNSNGKCVRQDKCPSKQCGRNEEYSTCGTCEKTCDNKDEEIVCTQECRIGCFCKKDYVRNSDGKCVRQDKCPSEQCGRNEEYSTCGTCEKTCDNKDENIVCTQECRIGCFCKKDYVRNSDGKCVPQDKCPSEEECGRNEEYNSCGNVCERTCANKDEPISCTQECKPGCFCKKGYVRISKGKCVRPKKCPSEPETCGRREQYYDCIPSCHNTCETYNRTDIACRIPCRPGCFCKEGYVLRKDNKCVRPAKCNIPTEPPPVCGEDEVYYDKCAPSCTGSCDTYGKEAVILCLPCKPGCWCKEGYVKDKDGKCIPLSKCPTTEPPQGCGEDEIFYDCVPKCRGTCETYNRHNLLCMTRCKPGCWCKKGLVKRKDGKCVPPKKCNKPTNPPTKPPQSCPTDQQYYPCIPTCKRTCMTYNSTDAYCTKECIRGCFCKEGLVMDKNGQCVKPEQCLPTCNFTEEYYDCKPDCYNRCNPSKVCNKVCRPGCFCRKDLLLRDDGMCVRKELCNDVDHSQHHCGPDKEYYDCYSRCKNKCSTRGKPVACPALCEKGCFCKKGMLLNKKGQCVAPEQCEDEGEFVSEESESFEVEGFEVEGFEVEGFGEEDIEEEDIEEEVQREVRIARQVYSEQDQETYGVGEQWSGGSRTGGASRQPPRILRPMNSGGRRYEFFSGRTNTKQCGPNEEWNECGSACPDTCDNYGQPQLCTLQCTVGCFCKNGFVLNARGTCIPPSECPGQSASNNRRRIPLRRGPGARTRGQVLTQIRLEDLRLEPSEDGGDDSYSLDGRSSEDLSRNGGANGYSEILLENNRYSDGNVGEEEWTWSEGGTSRSEKQSYVTDYSEEIVLNESEGSDEYTEWEIMSA